MVAIGPLDKLDPATAWQPWQPSAADPWNRKWAAHLYRRAAFGASRADLLEAERLGHDGTLTLLLRGKPGAAEMEETLSDVGRVAAENSIDRLRGWWMYGMLHSLHPLREKLTLFWHNHFATSDEKVQNALLMFRQNRLLRQHALGKFGPFLQAISKDPAMLFWLDSNRNVKEAPNENYARELMELFSLGVGNYTEKDIKEAARAFTGWHTDRSGFKFDSRAHDEGNKTFFGQTGNWDGGDIVRMVLERPVAARFLVRKLYHYLISETAEPPAALVEPLCDSFRKSEYDVAALVRTMLASKLFYSEHAFRQRVKSPVEFVLSAARATYLFVGEDHDDYLPLPPQVLVPRLAAMSQRLFAPPNVKGWPGARAWLTTSTVLERDNFAEALATGSLWVGEPVGEEYVPPKAFDAARLLREEKVEDPEGIVRAVLDLYVPGGFPRESQAKLVAFVAEGRPTGSALARRVRETVHAVLTTAEFQLA